jgi:hypothetical protein
MPPVPQHITDAKLTGIVIGAMIGGILLLGILPFLVFGLYLFVVSIWRGMFRDRAQYLLDEKARAAWNAEARREARLRYNAMAIVREWADKNVVLAEGPSVKLSVLVSGL